MKRISLDRAWIFTSDKQKDISLTDIPHDFTISTDVSPDAVSGAATGYYRGGRGIYEKIIPIPEKWKDCKMLVEFDGVYGLTKVSFNGVETAFHPYGYTPFHADITPFAEAGKDGKLCVEVDNSKQLNSRWYSGSGIYRHVDLLVGEKVHIAPWGIYAHTDRITDGAAYVTVEITVLNETEKAGEFRVFAEIGGISESRLIHIEAKGKSVCRLRLIIPDAKIWDIDTPDLYTVNARVEEKNGRITDSDFVSFGIRTVSVDVKNGFMLNGKTVKLKGSCIHHDNGILGAASFYDSEYRKLSLLKNNGFNAVRSAHNPPSRDMLDICDKIGLIVMDEAFDMWRIGKNQNDYHLYFDDNWEKDMESFILRDRNHPSVVIWSIGNEVSERGGGGNGYAVADMLANKVRSLDPRPVTSAVCLLWNGTVPDDAADIFEKAKRIEETEGAKAAKEFSDANWGKYTEPFGAVLDIMGYNYLPERYENDGKQFPDRIICGTESFPKDIAFVWDKVEKLPYVIGDFTWTGFDYLGEAGIGKSVYYDETETADLSSPYPWRLANDSDFDICGFDRTQLHLRKAVWGSSETYIAVGYPENYGKKANIGSWSWPACENSWTWPGHEGKPTVVDVYSASEEVELILNGESLGRKAAGKANGYTATFNIIYTPGTLTAVSYTDGKEISRDEIATTGEPAALNLTSDVYTLRADGCSLAYITAEITDSCGRRVPYAEIPCTASVSGAGKLAAFGIARPITEENYTTGKFTSFNGRVLLIVRSGWEAGEITVKITAEGLGAQTMTLSVG